MIKFIYFVKYNNNNNNYLHLVKNMELYEFFLCKYNFFFVVLIIGLNEK